MGAVDEKLQQLTRKKELLEQYKKGAMQQLFSQKLRFKIEGPDSELVDAPEWEEKRLGEIYTYQTTNSLSRDALNYETGEIKNIHYGDIHTKFRSQFDVVSEKVPFINPNVDLSKMREEQFCREGDLVIADASEDYADIGKTIEIKHLNDERVLAGLHTYLARPNSELINNGFGGYLFQSWIMRYNIMRLAQGSKVLSISRTNLDSIEIKLPSKQEQQKIADFLSALDKKIEAVSRQIEQTRVFKKGLLQQMFV